jgi:hypothetical protein
MSSRPISLAARRAAAARYESGKRLDQLEVSIASARKDVVAAMKALNRAIERQVDLEAQREIEIDRIGYATVELMRLEDKL